MDVDYFRKVESKAKKIVKSYGDGTTVLNSKVVTIMHIGCKWLLFSLSQKKLRKRTNSILKKKK